MVNVPQRQHNEEYFATIGGQVRIRPDLLFPAGPKR